MTHQGPHEHDVQRLGPTDTDLLRAPLDFIAQDHLHVRAMCAEIDRLMAAETMNHSDQRRVQEFLARDLPVHLSDEEDDLFPMMLTHAEPDDEMPRLKRRLEDEHAHAHALLPEVLAVFAAPGPTSATDAARRAVQDFTGHLRRHLILETAVLMPLARIRLTKAGLAELSLSMRRRRGFEQSIAQE